MTESTPEERAERWLYEIPRKLRTPELKAGLAAEIFAAVDAERFRQQYPMECGHALGNLLTCPDPPEGCVICLNLPEKLRAAKVAALERAVTAIESLMSHDGPNYDDTPENHALADARDAVLSLNPESQG